MLYKLDLKINEYFFYPTIDSKCGDLNHKCKWVITLRLEIYSTCLLNEKIFVKDKFTLHDMFSTL
jgi:hypothetical protein